jgi:Double-GTPase 2
MPKVARDRATAPAWPGTAERPEAAMFWYLILLAVILVVALIIMPLVVTGYGLRWIWGCGRAYLTSFAQVLGIPEASTAVQPPPPPRQRTDDGREPAYEQYLFGQVRRDLTAALSRTWTQARREIAADGRRILERWLAGPWVAEDLGRRLFGVLLLIGLAAGTLAGGFLLGVVAVTQALLVMLCVGLGLSVIFVLRAVDSALLRVRGIRMTCPECYRHIPYPSYRCPSCGALHRDVRPGRYGVLRRRCACGEESLPTLLILGSHRLAAFCPYGGCGKPLADTAGTAAEAMLALFGGSNVGKTRLLTIMVMALQAQAAGGTAVEFADRLTARRLEELLAALRGNQLPPRTGPDKPRAYSLYLRLGDARRQLVHFFDTGGERFYDPERLAALEYFRSARTLIFVIDPFSIDGVWNALPPGRREQLSPRADHSPWYVFQQLARSAREMRADVKQIRLAVAVSKADVLAEEKLPAPVPDSASIERWLAEMEQDHLVKSMRQTFGQVRFFHTSAVLSDGAVSPEINDLLAWTLRAPLASPSGGAGVSQ